MFLNLDCPKSTYRGRDFSDLQASGHRARPAKVGKFAGFRQAFAGIRRNTLRERSTAIRFIAAAGWVAYCYSRSTALEMCLPAGQDFKPVPEKRRYTRFAEWTATLQRYDGGEAGDKRDRRWYGYFLD